MRFCCLFALTFSVLCSRAQVPKLILPVGHTHTVSQVVFSPDGRLIATGSKDKTIKLWDVPTGRLLANLKGHAGEIASLSFNAAGDRILSTAALDTNAYLWNATNGSLVAALHSSSYIDQVAFSPDGRTIFRQASGEKPRLYRAQNGVPLLDLQTTDRYVEAAAFSPDGKKLAGSNGEVWDAETGALLFTLQGASGSRLVQFNPNGRQILTATSYGKAIKVWDATSGAVQFELTLTEAAKQFCFSPDGRRLVTAAGHTPVARLWDLEKGSWVADLGGNDYYLVRIAFSADSKTVVTNGSTGAHAWDAGTGERLEKGVPVKSFISTHPRKAGALVEKDGETYMAYGAWNEPAVRLEGLKGVLNAAFHPTEEKMAALEADAQTVAIWHAGTGKKMVRLRGPGEQIGQAYLNPQRTTLLTSAGEHTRFWSVHRNLLQAVSAPPLKNVRLARYSPDGKLLVLLRDEGGREVSSLWDAATLGALNADLKKRPNTGADREAAFQFSSDSKKLYVADNDWGGLLVETPAGKPLREVKHESSWASVISADATRLARYGAGGLEIREVSGGATLTSFPYQAAGYEPVLFTGYKNRFLLFDAAEVALFEENGKTPLLRFPNGVYHFNRDRNKLLVRSIDTLRIWDLAKARLQWQGAGPEYLGEGNLWDAVWAPDEKGIYYSTNRGTIRRIDLATGQPTPVSPALPKAAGYAKRLSFSPGGHLLFAVNEEVVTVYDARTTAVRGILEGHDNPVVSVMALPDSTRLLTVAQDHTARVWDAASGQLLYSFLLLGEPYQLSLLPSGYYQANPAASKLLHYVDDRLRPISFEQLDVRYNRPDLVLKATGSTDTALISSYRRAYVKRIQRLGIDTTAFGAGFGLPEADFVNRAAIRYEQKEGFLDLHIRGRDSAYLLDRLNLWVNESPLFGVRGLSLRQRNRHAIDTTIRVRLSAGINVLEATVANVNGTESYRMPLTVAYTPATPPKEKLYFVGIGIDRFKDAQHNLNYSVKDVRDLALKMREKYGDDVVIDTLFNENVTQAGIRALKKKLLATTVNDRVLLSYSGHGLLSKDYDYYLSTFAVNFQKPEEGGLPYEVLESLLDSIPARKKLMLIDACHSGEVDKEEMEKIAAVNAASAPGEGAKGATPILLKTQKTGMKNSFELMQELFVNVGRSTGATVIAAAAGTQFALERGDLKNGVFTYAILEYLREHPGATVSGLKQYVNKRVPELTKGAQVPTTRTEARVVDWNLW
ncbi:MAG TPA: caspase family protein [Chitinophagaceae bacterium]